MEKSKLAPIVLFVYNRPEHTKKTVEALKRNQLAKKSKLFIFSDGPRNKKAEKEVGKVRDYIRNVKGFKQIKIIEWGKNFGLAESVKSGVARVVNKHGKIIVLEDDLVTSPFFLKYMNDALALYKNENKVGALSGYIYPIKKKLPETFFLHFFSCWGWATWKDKWNLFEENGEFLFNKIMKTDLKQLFNINNTYSFSRILRSQVKGLNDSWAVRFYASLLINKKLVLYPKRSLVRNIGFDDTGTHGQRRKIFDVSLCREPIGIKSISLKQNNMVYKELQKYFKSIFWERIFSKTKKLLKNPKKELRNL